MEWGQFERGVYLVNCLGIMYDSKRQKILIGRRQNDPHIKELTWSFPGGRPNYDEPLEEGLRRVIRIKTGLDTKIKELFFARNYPERKEFLSLYYLCEVIGGKEKAGELFEEIRWINPRDVKQYFTTSIHPRVLEYLQSLTRRA